MHLACVVANSLCGTLLAEAVSLVSPKLWLRDLEQAGWRFLTSGHSPSGLEQLLLGLAIAGGAEQRGFACFSSPPALPVSSCSRDQRGISAPLLCENQVNEARGAMAATWLFHHQPAVVLLSLRGSKKQKKQGRVNILFLFHLVSLHHSSCGSWDPS